LFVRFQIGPSLAALATGQWKYAIGFLVIIAITLIFGRVFCSCLCPLGIWQDFISFIARRIRKNPAPISPPPKPGLRFALLILTLAGLALGYNVVLIILDPYSIMGRFFILAADPIISQPINVVSSILETQDVYLITYREVATFTFWIYTATIILFVISSVMAWFHGRYYCNTLCPVGTLLGLAAHFSPLRIFINDKTCTRCGLCEKTCRAQCLSIGKRGKNKEVQSLVHTAQCVMCLDCLTVCPVNSTGYGREHKHITREGEIPSPSRRKVLAGMGLVVVSGLGLRNLVHGSPKIAAGESGMACPPGAGSVKAFTERCTACYLCVTACPTKVLQPEFMAYGARGILQPAMNFRKGFCNYDCIQCGEVCPAGAILPYPVTEKQRIRIGRVVLFKEKCVVYINNEECGACVEVCPTHAVYTEERDGVLYPEIDPEVCIGCGACEHVCPQDPRAIIVAPLAVHEEARHPYLDAETALKGKKPDAIEEAPQKEQLHKDTDGFPF
jgi:polyferredoxin